MLVRALAVLGLLLLLAWLFRLAMGLRWTKIEREQARRQQEGAGRRLVAELPLEEGVALFLEDAHRFYSLEAVVEKEEVLGARLLLNRAVVATARRPTAALPDPPPVEETAGRERWEVVAYLSDGSQRTVRCGAVREGISREAARAVFEALRRAIEPGSDSRGGV